MSNKQLVALFFCSLVPWIAGNGLVPLLPVYATQLGANAAVAGLYLAISYLAIAVGALSAGWVSERFHSRKLPLLVSGIAGIPVAWMMGQVDAVWLLTILTAALWLCGGLGLALINILTGLSAGENERGRVFGIIALTGGMGAIIGGLGAGWLVDGWGFTVMFNVLAVFLALWPVSALFVEDKGLPPLKAEPDHEERQPGLGRGFYMLFTANILSSIAGFFVVLIRSLVMNDLGFGSFEISSTGVVGSLVGMPVPLVMGFLSDRMGRKTFLYVGYLLSLTGLVLLAFSAELWHFWIVFVLQGIAAQNGGTIGNAVVTDLLPKKAFSRGMAMFGATGWIGGMIGFAVAGAGLQNFGLVPTYIIGSLIALAAIGLIIPIKVDTQKQIS